MELVIRTTDLNTCEISLVNKTRVIAVGTEKVDRLQSRNLLQLVEKLLKEKKLNIKEIKSIRVENQGQGFTSLRVQVTIANALAYALAIPIKPTTGKIVKKQGIDMVEPLYSQPPNITTKK